MDKDTATSSPHEPRADSYVPPPTDPYVTYQTPYPRRPSEEVQNPFIEFRRLADSVFSSFFSSLPRILGTENFKAANQRESEEEYRRVFEAQAKHFESRVVEMARLRAEEVEGFRKRMEQELEERRRESEKRIEEESQRWEMMRRGLENCPGLRAEANDSHDDNIREAETELDLYDGLRAYEARAYTPSASTAVSNGTAATSECPWKSGVMSKKCPWDGRDKRRDHGWMSGLGFDGRRRAKNIPLYLPSQSRTQPTQDKNVEWKEYQDDEMDPFTDDDHVVPWMKLSPYSPLLLMNNDAWTEAFDQPRPSDLPYNPLSDFPFDEAFEDLMAVHKTGQLPRLLKQLVYPSGPNHWMMDMVQRGVLGPQWEESFMAAGLLNHEEKMGAVDGNMWRGFDGFKKQWSRLAHREFGKLGPRTAEIDDQLNDEDEYEQPEMDQDYPQWEDLVRSAIRSRTEEAMQELVQTIFGDRQQDERPYGARGMLWPSPEEVFGALTQGKLQAQQNDSEDPKADQETDPEKVAPVNEPWPSLSASSWTSSADEKPESIISTMTTTTTRTLPDGSTETRRILKKRFADGREEKSESTEVKPGFAGQSLNQEHRHIANETSKDTKSQNGWFWN